MKYRTAVVAILIANLITVSSASQALNKPHESQVYGNWAPLCTVRLQERGKVDVSMKQFVSMLAEGKAIVSASSGSRGVIMVLGNRNRWKDAKEFMTGVCKKNHLSVEFWGEQKKSKKDRK